MDILTMEPDMTTIMRNSESVFRCTLRSHLLVRCRFALVAGVHLSSVAVSSSKSGSLAITEN
jgi:hypothetical protein